MHLQFPSSNGFNLTYLKFCLSMYIKPVHISYFTLKNSILDKGGCSSDRNSSRILENNSKPSTFDDRKS